MSDHDVEFIRIDELETAKWNDWDGAGAAIPDASYLRTNKTQYGEVFMFDPDRLLLICCFCDAVHETMQQFSEHIRREHLDSDVVCDDVFEVKIAEVDFESQFNVQDSPAAKSVLESADEGESESSHKDAKSGKPEDNCDESSGQAVDSDLDYEPATKKLGQTKVKRVTCPESKRNLFCRECNRQYKTVSTFNVHLQNVHEKKKSSLQCNYCDKEFPTAEELQDHKSSHDPLRPFQCPHCPKSFQCRRYRENHINWHMGDIPYKCFKCPKAFTNDFNLRHHLLTKHEIKTPGPDGVVNPLSCEICGKMFVHKSKKDMHMRWHTGESPFQCKLCGRKFRLGGLLTQHMKRHNNERNYKCKVCGKDFYTSRMLNDHQVVHSTEKPFECDDCGKTFSRRLTLNLHRKNHSDVYQYLCNICGKQFKQSSGLYCHKRTHGITKDLSKNVKLCKIEIVDEPEKIEDHQNILPNKNVSGSLSQTSFSSLPTSSYSLIDFEFIPGKRANSSILYSRTENQMYGFNSRTRLGKSYLCTFCRGRKRLCNARVYLVDGDNTCIKLFDKQVHNHPERLIERNQMVALNEIKHRCGQLESFLSTTRLTVRDIFNQVLFENPGVELDFRRYERTLQLIREKATPKSPTNCSEIATSFCDEEISKIFGRSTHGDKSVFFDGVIEKQSHSFCVFSSKYIISLIEKHVDPCRRHFMLDGTFKVRPIGPFMQLLTMHVVYMERAFPFIFILISRKTEEAYFDVFSFVHENIIDLTCAKLTIDYEVAMRNAFRRICPTALMFACWFHFVQSVKQYASQIAGFKAFLQSEDEANVIFQQLLCLPLLPPEHMSSTFNLLKQRAYAIDKAAFLHFFAYFKRQWLVREGIVKICNFGQAFQTTGSLETHHLELEKCIRKYGSFFPFVLAINQQEFIISNEMNLYIETGGLLTDYKQQRLYTLRNKKIEAATKRLQNGTISAIDFINKVRHNDNNLCVSLSKMNNEGDTVVDDETDLNREIAAEIEAEMDHDSAIGQSTTIVYERLIEESTQIKI